MEESVEVRTTKAFYSGLRVGITMFAHWRDSTQYVGTTGRTLESALGEVGAQEAADLESLKTE